VRHLLLYVWDALLSRLGYERRAQEKWHKDPNVQVYDDIAHINWLAMAVSKIANLACTDSTMELETDSALVEPLEQLCKDLEDKRFTIVEAMLGTGDCFVFPAYDSTGELYNCIVDDNRVVVLENDGENIKKAYVILDIYKPENSTETYFLIRSHELDDSGTLTISYDVINTGGVSAETDKWQEWRGISTRYIGANHIGFGQYKSPVCARALSGVYGVPLNFGCGEIEKQVNETMSQIIDEFTNGKSKIFTDPRNLAVVDDGTKTKKYRMIENIFPIKRNAGDNAPSIDIFNPQIRASEHFEKLERQLGIYEQQMGLSKGILTENEVMATGTATAVRRANSDTIAFISNVHNALDKGNISTLEADAVFLNIRRELWNYNSDYFDVFADSQEQFNMLVTAHNAGAVSRDRLTAWLYPQMTDDQIAEELAKVDELQRSTAINAVEAALMK